MRGKTVVITGATGGIGLEAAVSLATQGARTILVGRNPAKTAAAVETVRKRSGSATVESTLCDFSSQASVRKLAADLRARCERIHVLVNNAGGVYPQRTLTGDGIESTFAVNHLGYFLLTNLMVDVLLASAPARIVNVASAAHYRGTMDFDDLGFERGYQITKAYARSKLANILFTRELARRLAGTGVTVNTLHPGTVATNIWSSAPGWVQPVLAVAKLFMISPRAGGERVVYLASSPEVEGTTGNYFEKDRIKTPSSLARDDALAARLWTESSRLVGLADSPMRPAKVVSSRA
jgi:NAD(P)-dependent dehydrogenase (short-subunit alcohol dehydrogenase family)